MNYNEPSEDEYLDLSPLLRPVTINPTEDDILDAFVNNVKEHARYEFKLALAKIRTLK